MAPTWTQSALGSAFIKHHRAPSALGTEEWDLTRTRNNEKVMREPAHVTHSQGKDKMYRVSSSGRSAVHFLSFLLFLLYTWNEKNEKHRLSDGELVKSHLLVKRNVLIFMISVFTSVRRTRLHHCFEVATEISALSNELNTVLFFLNIFLKIACFYPSSLITELLLPVPF